MADAMNWFEQGSGMLRFWTENQKSLLQALIEAKPPAMMAANLANPALGNQDAWGQWAQMWQQSMAGWTSAAPWAKAMMTGADPDEFRALLDPVEWAKRSSGLFDAGIAQLTEGPAFATMWDLDRKVLGAQKLWMQRNKDIAAYMQLVQGAWKLAGERFEKALQDPSGTPLDTGRKVLDEWIGVANEALLEMHRSPQFLEAQRRMTRSAAEYRLQERAIAEVFCAMHHIPTRTEMDEVQRTVYELRRELRAMRRGAVKAAEPPAERAAPKRKATKRKATKN